MKLAAELKTEKGINMARRKRRDTEPVLYAVIELIFMVCALPFILIAYLLGNRKK